MVAAPIRVLLITAEAALATHLDASLARDPGARFELTPAATLAEGLRRLSEAPFDLAVLDLDGLDGRGDAGLLALRQAGGGLPLVACARQTDPQAALLAVQAGAQEYFPVTPEGCPAAGLALRLALERLKLPSRTRAAEQQMEAALLALVGGIDMVYSRWKPDTTLTYANEKLRRIKGLNENPVGQKWIEMLPAAERPEVEAFYAELARNPRPVTYEHPIITADGNLRHYHWVDMPVPGAEGELEFQSVGVDITESKLTQLLMQAQRDLARLISTAGSAEEAWPQCLEAALRISGMDSGSIYLLDAGRRGLELVYSRGLGEALLDHMRFFPVESQNVQLMLKGGLYYFKRAEIQMDPLSFQEGLRSMASVPIKVQGEVTGCLNVTSHTLDEVPTAARQALEALGAEIGNLAAHLQTSAALRHSEALLAEAQRLGRIGHWEWVAPSAMMRCSPALLQILETPAVDGWLAQADLVALLPPDEQLKMFAHQRQAFESRSDLDFQFRIRLPGGRLAWLHQRARVAYGDDGQPLRMIGTMQDITEQKQMEQANQRYNEQLTAVAEIGRDVLASLELESIYEALRAGIYRLFADQPSLFISGYDTDRRMIRPLYGFHEGQRVDVSALPELPLSTEGKGNQSRVILTGQPVIITNGLKQSLRPETITRIGAPGGDDTRSAAYVPMLAQDKVTGVLQVQSFQAGRFTDNDIRVLTLVANTAAVAIQNARLFELAQRELADRQRAEAELQASEEKFATAFLASPVGMILSRASDGLILEVNHSWEAITGFSSQEGIGKTMPQLGIHPYPYQRQDLVEQMEAQGALHDLEIEIRSKTGELRQVSLSAERVRLRQEDCLLTSLTDITARKRAEQALRESERKYRQLYETMLDGFVRVDMDGKVLEYNRAYQQMLGYSDAELTAMTYIDYTPEHWRAYEAQIVAEQVLKRGYSGVYEKEYRRKDGALLPAELHTVLITDEQGQPTGMWAIARDIHERKEVELALRASEELYRGLIESLDSVVATVDYDGRFLYANEVAARQMGGARGQILGHTLQEVFPEPYASGHLTAVRRVFDTNQPTISEYATMVQGKLRWFRNSLQPLHDEDGRVTGVLINATDIHNIKAAQQELQELNTTLEQRVQARTAEVQDLYENAPVGYHSVDADRRLIMMNQTELDWLGYQKEEVLGRPITDFVSPATLAAFDAEFERFRQCGSQREVEYEVVRKNGSIFPVLVNRDAIYDENGDFLRTRSTVFDNTRRKAAELALLHTNLELERAMRLKDEFLANMSHELRTPLNGILGFTQILLGGYRGPLNADQHKYVQIIHSSGQHLLSLINDLLDISKIEAGKLEIHPETVAIVDVCQASLAFVREQATKKSLMVEFLPEPWVHTLIADPLRLKQILVNLLSNAVKFTPQEGRVTLQVLANLDREQIEFSVSDTGIGIAAEDLARLFNPFTQLDSGLTRQHEGTGLGLALVKRLAELHGGRVEVTSTPGVGSRFVVSLPWQPNPVEQMARQEAEAAAANPAYPGPAAFSASHPLILLAEDNEANILAVLDYLESLGCRVVVARDGLEALKLAQENLPALILMDTRMPEMDGLEATRRLRADPRFAATPIIALTALAMPGDRERCLEAGANDYLSKPVGLSKLAELIRNLIR